MKAVKVTGLAIAVILGALLPILIMGFPAGFLIGMFGDRITAQTGEKLQISGATLRLLPEPSLVLRGVEMRKQGDEAKPPHVTLQSVRVAATLASLLRGKPKVTEIRLVKPVVRVPQVRRAEAASAGAEAGPAPARPLPDIERVVVEDGSVLFVRPSGRIKDRFDHIDLTATLSQPEHHADVKVEARLGERPLHIHLASKAPLESIDQSLPLALRLEAPGLLQGPLTGTMTARVVGSLVTISDLRGTIGNDGFNGHASIAIAGKPQLKLTLGFKRLSLAAAPAASSEVGKDAASASPAANAPASASGERPWSDARMDFEDLNFIDAHVALTAAELDLSRLTLSPVYIEAALSNGVLNLAVSNTGVYGGTANGLFTLDASGDLPQQAMSMNLRGVRAAPLLSALADFHALEGKMRAQIDVQASGTNEHAVVSTLAGSADLDFRDGAIRNINVAQMVRNLTRATLQGWQKERAAKTDLNELSARFRIAAGRATTDDLKLLGPLVRVNGAGTADLAAKTLRFKLDTKLVMSLEGQGGPADPVGFGVPVMVEGSWRAPRIYPDIAGILDNPGAAYGKLHDLGVGLFGSGFNNLFGNSKPAGGTSTPDQGGNAQSPAAGAPEQGVPAAVNNILHDIFGK